MSGNGIHREEGLPGGGEIAGRLRRLSLYRIVGAVFLLLYTLYYGLSGSEILSPAAFRILYCVTGGLFLLSFLYFFLSPFVRPPGFHIRLQYLGDIFLITVLVYGTGGAGSVYAVLYSLVIIYAVLFLGRQGGLLTASMSTIFYGVILNLEYHGVFLPPASPEGAFSHSGDFIFTRLLIYAASFFVIAFLASFVVEQEKRTRTLLSEKESAFERLDLLYRSIVESVETGIMTVDREGRIKSFNSSAERITGFSFSAIRDLPVEHLFPGMTGFFGEEGTARRGRPHNRFEKRFVLGERGEAILGFSLSPLVAPGGTNIGRIIIFQDLTAIKEMEKEVERTRRLALVGEMAAVLAHEIRNPLSSISGSVQILKRDFHPDGSTGKLMDIMTRGKDQLEALLRDFLLLARPGTGEITAVDPEVLMETVIDSLRYGADWNERIELATRYEGKGVLAGRASELRQVFTNVLQNALQSMPEGGKLTVTTKNFDDPPPGGLEVAISDTGGGIEEERMEKIFEPFYTTKERGTGLGLAIVSRIVSGHGGRVRISSRIGEGTTVTVRLPLHEEEAR
jgi:two-component system sensor histidine kinase PilS (NtrC family)